jgi:hypothetical protein
VCPDAFQPRAAQPPDPSRRGPATFGLASTTWPPAEPFPGGIDWPDLHLGSRTGLGALALLFLLTGAGSQPAHDTEGPTYIYRAGRGNPGNFKTRFDKGEEGVSFWESIYPDDAGGLKSFENAGTYVRINVNKLIELGAIVRPDPPPPGHVTVIASQEVIREAWETSGARVEPWAPPAA